MDLRKKASPVKRLGENLLRFRLISLVLFAVLLCLWGRHPAEAFSYAADVGSGLLSSLSGLDGETISANGEFFLSALGTLVLILVLRFLLGGAANGISFVICAVIVPGLFVGGHFLGEWALPVFGGVLALAFVLFFAVRVAVFKVFFPAILCAYFWTAVSFAGNLPEELCAGFAVLTFADLVPVAWISGRELSKGSPVAGALVGGFSKGFLPMVLSNVLFGIWAGFHFLSQASLAWIIACPFISAGLFLVVEFPLMSFAPFSKMRAAQRTMELRTPGKS